MSHAGEFSNNNPRKILLNRNRATVFKLAWRSALHSQSGEAMIDYRTDISSNIIKWLVWAVAAVLIVMLCIDRAASRDAGQWKDTDPNLGAWYKSLMQPDNPNVPCCGESDAYWADNTETGPNGELIAIITDDRPDEPLKRRHVPVGTKILVPPHKITWKFGNPTFHTVIFLNASNEPFCYVQNGGV